MSAWIDACVNRMLAATVQECSGVHKGEGFFVLIVQPKEQLCIAVVLWLGTDLLGKLVDRVFLGRQSPALACHFRNYRWMRSGGLFLLERRALCFLNSTTI